MNIGEIAVRFDGVKWTGKNKFQCLCPVHMDSEPSLSVKQSGEKLLIYCHAGCDTSDILAAVGLSFDDINGGKKSYEWRAKLVYGMKQRGTECTFKDEYKYFDEKGRYLYSKVRMEGNGKKYIRYVVVDDVNDTYSYLNENDKKTLYRLPQLLKSSEKGDYPIYYCEGEKDVNTLAQAGLTATTAGGASDWKDEYSRYFIGRTVIILQDNDEAGEKLRQQIVKSLKKYAFKIVWATTSQQSRGDVTDYIEEGHSIDDVKQLIAKSEQNGNYCYASYVMESEDRQGNKKLKINPAILARVISETTDYIQVRNPIDDKEDVYVYSNGIYKLHNSNMLDNRIMKYIPLNLQSVSVIDNTRKMLIKNSKNITDGADINSDERYINFRNGLYDIKDRHIIPHTPDIVFTSQLDCDYDEHAHSRSVFDRYINDLCTTNGVVNEDKKKLLQEWFGLLISNIPVFRVKKCLILFSSLGNTGKSQFVNLLCSIIGKQNISSVPLQDLSERFSISYLYGKRLNAVGDQQYTDIGTSSVFKQLTGGDSLKCEAKGRQAISFTFRGGIIFACNDLPSFQDDKGGHIFERMCIVPCNNVIPEQQREGGILSRMETERTSVVNWALEGLHRLIDNNFIFTRCEECEEEKERYRSDIDTLHRYLSENYVLTGNAADRILKTDFEKDYSDWCIEQEVHSVGKRNIVKRMEKNGIEYGKVNGNRYYKGLAPLRSGSITNLNKS